MRRAALAALVAVLAGCAAREARMAPRGGEAQVVVLVSAEAEWAPVKALLGSQPVETSPAGEWARARLGPAGTEVVLLHGGYGKVAAAASTQWAIDAFAPRLLVNLGTCGGFEGATRVGEVVLASETVAYDVVERMGDGTEAIADFSSVLPVRWPEGAGGRPVRPGRLLSGDQDLDPAGVPALRARFGGVGGDWESGAIAFVARKNRVPLLVLRMVSDVVAVDGGSPTYGNLSGWQAVADRQMRDLVELLGEGLPGVMAGELVAPRAMAVGEVLRQGP